jgi:hypothetical protein
MAWKLFTDLTPSQSIAAKLHLDNLAPDVSAPLRRKEVREFLLVDDEVRGSRLNTKRSDALLNAILGEPKAVRSKTDLADWSPMPKPFTMTHD